MRPLSTLAVCIPSWTSVDFLVSPFSLFNFSRRRKKGTAYPAHTDIFDCVTQDPIPRSFSTHPRLLDAAKRRHLSRNKPRVETDRTVHRVPPIRASYGRGPGHRDRPQGRMSYHWPLRLPPIRF